MELPVYCYKVYPVPRDITENWVFLGFLKGTLLAVARNETANISFDVFIIFRVRWNTEKGRIFFRNMVRT